MPTNTFGPGDNYNLQNSHFIPAILKKIYLAKLRNKKSIKLWGTGKAKREVIYVDDLADAVIYFMNKRVKHNLINIGTSNEKSIKQYVKYIFFDFLIFLFYNKLKIMIRTRTRLSILP